MSLLDQWGIGVSQVIGVGGRDLSAGVGGLMAAKRSARWTPTPVPRSSCWSPSPPTPTWPGRSSAPAGPPGRRGLPRHVRPRRPDRDALLADTLEQGALQVTQILRNPYRKPQDLTGAIERAAARMDGARQRRTWVLHRRHLVLRGPGRAHPSARPGLLQHPATSRPRAACAARRAPLPGPRRRGVHQGPSAPDDRPGGADRDHAGEAFGGDIAAVLLDVVLVYGSHPDPAGEIADTCADLAASGTAVIAYVLGARADRQGLDRQRRTLSDAGAIVPDSAAEAARVAAAVAARRPALATAGRP